MEIVIVVVFIIIFVIGVVISISNSNERKDKMATRQTALGYIFTREIKHRDNRYIFGISEANRKVIVIFPNSENVLNYEDILGVDVVVDGHMVASRSLGKVIGASALGGVAGAMTVNQKISKKVSDIHVDIHTRDLKNPNIRLQVLNHETDVYKMDMDSANEIANLVKIIIDKVEQEERAKTQNVSMATATNVDKVDSSLLTPASSNLIAEELTKLAELKDKGILSEEEFAAQKQKLLGL